MPDFPFSKRTDWIAHSNALNDALEHKKSKGIPIADLTESNPTRAGLQYPASLLKDFDVPENLLYQPDSKGMLNGRRAVAEYYRLQGQTIDPEHVVLTSSTSEAYAFLFRLLVNEGEHVLIPRPSYPLFQFLLELNDAQFDYYPLVYRHGWSIDRQAVERLITPSTRAIVLVNPNNPTGSYLNSDDLSFLNDLCRKHHMTIISDEVFFDYAWGDQGDVRSCAGNPQVLTFTLSGLSKIMALPQMKCAWIAASGPKPVLEEAMARLEIIADTFLSVNTPVQNALGAWLVQAKDVQRQIMTRIGQNRKALEEVCVPCVEVLSTQGGWYAIARIPKIHSEEQWVLKFLNEDHVLVHPGYFFDFEEGVHIIISLLPEPCIFKPSIKAIMQRIAHEAGDLRTL